MVVNRAAICASGIAIVGTPQPSTPIAPRRDQLGDPLLQRVRGIAVGMQRPAVRAAGGEHAGVLAGAVVAELAVGASRLRAVLEIVDVDAARASTLRTAASCAGSAWCEAQAIAISSAVEVVVAVDERDRLQRLHRRAEMADELGIAAPLAAGRDDVDVMDRLDRAAALDGYADRVHPLEEPNVAGVAGGRSLASATRPAGRAVAGRAGRAGPHRDAEDVRPAARGRWRAGRCESSDARSGSCCRRRTASSC